MPTPKLRDPLLGNPPTKQSKDKDGLPVFTIRPNELTAARARFLDGVNKACTLAMAAYAFTQISAYATDPVQCAVIAGWAWAANKGLARVAKWLISKQTTVVMTTAATSVKRGSRWHHYGRNFDHAFVLVQHHEARNEQLQHDLAVRKAAARGRIIQPKPIKSETYFVVLMFGGHQIILYEVFGQQEATSGVARFQYCDRALDEANRMGDGLHQSPERQWNDVPGGLNDA